MLQAVIVSIRIATYIGVTILVVALSYKLKKVNHMHQIFLCSGSCAVQRIAKVNAQYTFAHACSAGRFMVHFKYCCPGQSFPFHVARVPFWVLTFPMPQIFPIPQAQCGDTGMECESGVTVLCCSSSVLYYTFKPRVPQSQAGEALVCNLAAVLARYLGLCIRACKTVECAVAHSGCVNAGPDVERSL